MCHFHLSITLSQREPARDGDDAAVGVRVGVVWLGLGALDGLEVVGGVAGATCAGSENYLIYNSSE